jgi:hypothetical protein
MKKPSGVLRATIIARALSLLLVGGGILGLVASVPLLTIPWPRPFDRTQIFFYIFGLIPLFVCLWWLHAAWLGWRRVAAAAKLSVTAFMRGQVNRGTLFLDRS